MNTTAGLEAEDFDTLDNILDDLRERFEETPQWEFCEGFMAALVCCRRAIPDSEWLPLLLGIDPDETEGGCCCLASLASAMEQARNIELRLSHMEHSLEDNRRFITSRVSRELQGLRQALREELGTILQQQPPAIAQDTTEVVAPANNTRWGLGVVLVAGILVSLYFLLQINNRLEQNARQQNVLTEQLHTLIQQAPAAQVPSSTTTISAQNAALNNTPTVPASANATTDSINYLDDLAWTFNQQGALAFRQYTIDTSCFSGFCKC